MEKLRSPGLACLLLAMLATTALGCRAETQRATVDLREAVLASEWPPTKTQEYLASGATPTCEETRWLIEKLTDTAPLVRLNAALALRNSRSPATASVLYLALASEQDGEAYMTMIRSLGWMGAWGKPYLVRALKERGICANLLMALAQSSGVRPSHRGQYPLVNMAQASDWWDDSGSKELEKYVPAHPTKEHPAQLGIPSEAEDTEVVQRD